MIKTIILFLLLIIEFASAQQSEVLSLDWCNQKARENYPLIKQGKLLSDAYGLKIKNLNVNYYPTLNLNAQATYQSDVTKLDASKFFSQFPIKITEPLMPDLSKDNYKVTLDVGQVIWDGGATGNLKEVESKSLIAEKQSIEVELYKLKERVNAIYFNILSLQKSKEVLNIFKSELQARLKTIDAAIAEGAMLASNSNALQAEIAKVNQQLVELEWGRRVGIAMLKDFVGKEVPESTILAMPIEVKEQNTIRPEFDLFNYQIDRLTASEDLIGTKNMPKLAAFAQIGYGRPGLNMLKNDFANFYIVGARFTWNFWNWNQSTHETEILKIQKDIINTQKETFAQSLQINSERLSSDVKKYIELIEYDHEIIKNKNATTATATSQFNNGTITSTELLTELNGLIQARLNLESHIILQAKTRVDFFTLNGNF